MSRGPGKWQRLVLDLVERADGAWVPVDTVWRHAVAPDAPLVTLPMPDYWKRRPTQRRLSVESGAANHLTQPLAPSAREAIRRAIRTLAAAGEVEAAIVHPEARSKHPWVLAARTRREAS